MEVPNFEFYYVIITFKLYFDYDRCKLRCKY